MGLQPTDVFVPIMLIALIVLLLLTSARDATRQPGRATTCLVAGFMALTYIVWRMHGAALATAPGDATAWIWACTAIEVVGLLDFLQFVVMMSRYRDRVPEADQGEARFRALPPDQLPHVDVWIATYNEDWEILEKTIVGALALDWPKDRIAIHVLDDGRRDWLREKCLALGLNHVTRPNNIGKKAGNHNNALAHTNAPFILSLDADFIPFPQAIYRMIGLMDDPVVGIVQSPQTFYNAGPLRNNLMMHRAIPEDLAFFYKAMQPSRDAWRAAFYCGTGALLRRKALEDVGGFAPESDIEDQITSLKLWSHGWETHFLSERISCGLAPESVAALHDQRNRWCRGSLQILFTRYGPFGPGFSLSQRLFFLQTYWLLGAILPLFYACLPAAIWLTGARLYPHMPAAEIVLMPVMLLVGIWSALGWLGQRTWVPVLEQAWQLYMAVEMLPTAISSIIKPFGKPLIRINLVTAKGDSAERRPIDWPTATVLLAVVLVTVIALLLAAFVNPGLLRDPMERAGALAWTLYNLLVCGIALLACFELPYRRREERIDTNEPASLSLPDGSTMQVVLDDLSVTGASLRSDDLENVRLGDEITLAVTNVGTLGGRIVRLRRNPIRVGIAFAEVEQTLRHALIRRVFLVPESAEPDNSVTARAILGGLAARFMRRDF